MVNWQSPETLAADYAYLLKTAHMASGIYIWEWFVNLGFDYRLIAHTKSFKLGVITFFVCRWTALLMASINLGMLDATRGVNCRTIFNCFFIAGYTCVVTSSVLVALRTIAIWKQNQYVTWLLTLALLAYGGVSIYDVIIGNQSGPSGLEGTCGFSHFSVNKINVTFGIALDAVSLILALVGVRVLWSQAVGGLYRTLYHQGIIWIVIITVIYTISLVFLWLNLNEYVNMVRYTFVFISIMTQTIPPPTALSLAIAATRMFRGLYEVSHANVVHPAELTTSDNSMKAPDCILSVNQSAADCHNHDTMAVEVNHDEPRDHEESASVPRLEGSNPENMSDLCTICRAT